MNTIQILSFLGLPTATVGFFFYLIKRELNKKEKREIEREQAREEHNILTTQAVFASLSLGEATARAIQTGKSNGELSNALEYAVRVKHNSKDFLTKQGIKNIY